MNNPMAQWLALALKGNELYVFTKCYFTQIEAYLKAKEIFPKRVVKVIDISDDFFASVIFDWLIENNVNPILAFNIINAIFPKIKEISNANFLCNSFNGQCNSN